MPKLLRMRLSLSAWMLLCCALATLPLLIFALLATRQLVHEHQSDVEAHLFERASAGAASVRRVLSGPAELTLRALAGQSAPSGERGGCAVWLPHAELQLRTRAGALRLDLDTLAPPGAGPAPQGAAVDVQPRAFAMERGNDTARWVVPVLLETVPVGGGGSVAAAAAPAQARAWCIDVPVSEFASVFAEQHWPVGWTASVLDQHRRVVARNRTPELYVGRPATQALRARLDQGLPTGVFEIESLEGDLLRTVVAPVDEHGWVVVVGVPVAAQDKALWSSWRPLLIVGALCLFLGLGAAAWLARRLGRAVLQVASATGQTDWGELEPLASAAAPGSAPGPASALPGQAHAGPGRSAPKAVGNVGVVVELASLVSELRRARDHAHAARNALHGARHDILTGLPQRALFMQELRGRLDAGRAALTQGDTEAGGLAVLFIDLDGFKSVNDRFGHEAGDQVLRNVASVLRHCVRSGDVAGRLGGDEFVVAVTAPVDQVAGIAQAVAQRIVQGVRALGQGMGCSVGLMCSDGRLSAEELLGHADQAMFTAKRAGKNQVVVHRRCSACALPGRQACTQTDADPVHGPCEWRTSPPTRAP